MNETVSPAKCQCCGGAVGEDALALGWCRACTNCLPDIGALSAGCPSRLEKLPPAPERLSCAAPEGEPPPAVTRGAVGVAPLSKERRRRMIVRSWAKYVRAAARMERDEQADELPDVAEG